MKKSNIILYRPNFDPDKFKKPEPFYGFIHDKYLISDDANNLKKNDKTKDIRKSSFNINTKNVKKNTTIMR